MITADEITEKAHELKISEKNVQKDYVYGWLLSGIYQNDSLKDKLILKGGNALRKGYLANTRFSKDLDFSTLDAVDENNLLEQLKEVIAYVQDQTGVKFLIDKTQVRPKLVINNLQVYEGRTVFESFNDEAEVTLKVQMDVTEFDRIILPVQRRELIHPYSDSSDCRSDIICHKLEEVLASKLVGMLQRRRAGDLFDLAFAIIRNNYPDINRLEVISTFLKKTIYEAEPATAKQRLLGLPLEESRLSWNTLIAPITSLFGFDEATNHFNSLIENLFNLIPTLSYAPIGFGRPISRFPQSFGGYSGISDYSGDYRSKIINAGQSRTMLRLLYHGIWRLVEPYALRYYVRKKDNRGLEYFWAYDTTGGNSGKTTIKQFVSDDIESVEETSTSFFPRYPIEF